MSSTAKWVICAICAVLGIVALVYAVIYLAVPIHSLPGFVPGKKAPTGHYHKRAFALGAHRHRVCWPLPPMSPWRPGGRRQRRPDQLANPPLGLLLKAARRRMPSRRMGGPSRTPEGPSPTDRTSEAGMPFACPVGWRTASGSGRASPRQ